MKLNKKGFTLVELLAVIVVLAIIALIGYSVVGPVIEDSRKGGAESSANTYASKVSETCMRLWMSTQAQTLPEEDDVHSGALAEINGNKPADDADTSFTIGDNCSITWNTGTTPVVINGYNCTFADNTWSCN